MALVTSAAFERLHAQTIPDPLIVDACKRPGQILEIAWTTCLNRNAGQQDRPWRVRKPSGSATPAICRPAHSRWFAPSRGGWINAAPPNADAAGDYFYSLTFKLPIDPKRYADGTLRGFFIADNSGVVSVNGKELASCTSGMCFLMPTSYMTAGGDALSILRAGYNTLQFKVQNSSRGSTGLYADFSLALKCPT